MIFPSNFEQKLGFDALRQLLRAYCLSSLGRENVDLISFSTDPDEIEQWLSGTAEMRQILEFEEHFPAQDYYDMIPALLGIRIPGSYMEPEQLSELRLSLTAILTLIDFLSERTNKYPVLNRLLQQTEFRTQQVRNVALPAICHPSSANEVCPSIIELLARLDKILNEKSEIRDSASVELQRIRKEKVSMQTSVERKVVQCFNQARKSGWVPEDADITIRNGRLVIPMISTHKRKIAGFVHDESATGHTVFVEPAEIFETNNEIRELEYAERREIVKILAAFATLLRPDIELLIQAYRFLGKIDFIRAKGRLAINTGGRKPMLSASSSSLFWRGAIHPLLFLSHQKQKKEIVPLDIELHQEQRIIIISGPNAGGKSVCLKTVGLVQYMYQCGLLPPVKEDSEFCIFKNIFIDIGDEQSIDNDLSTYTSKLINLKFFLEHIDNHSLFLIDELGTGTDPSLGGAIAEATLESLNEKGAFGVVTTHYSNLKLLAGRLSGIVNGAMLFDLKKLKPLYQLKTGKPGSSFALEIAHEIGFPEDVLQIAREKTGKSQLDFDRELQNLDVEKIEIKQKSTELKIADDFLSELIRKYEKLTSDLESRKKEILENAREEARELLSQSNKVIEKTIREIREAQAEKTQTKAARQNLSTLKTELEEKNKSGSPASPAGKQHLLSKVEQPIHERSEPIGRRMLRSQVYPDFQQKVENFTFTLDLRGKRVDEAQMMLQRYIDDAILLSIHEVNILHGKGNGVLRQVTRDYLRLQKEVKTARDAALEQGGAGITVVTFR
ncbi:MAG: Smr/MutS family protein [Bacteroidales bacterium]|nr:Smr/MutS family protein [Bacteroidales bacterium]